MFLSLIRPSIRHLFLALVAAAAWSGPVVAEQAQTAEVMVAPVQGRDAKLGRRVAAVVHAELEAQGLEATRRSTGLPQFLLSGKMSQPAPWPATGNAPEDVPKGKRASVNFTWTLLSPNSLSAGRLRAAIADRSDAALKSMAVRVAELTASQIKGFDKNGATAPARRALALLDIPRIAVPPVDGARGNGDDALAAAMRDELQEIGYPVTDEPDEQTYLLLGDVFTSPGGADNETVEITWILLMPAGDTIGRVSQTNRVPLGALDKTWGSVAKTVAKAALDGILPLLDGLAPLP